MTPKTTPRMRINPSRSAGVHGRGDRTTTDPVGEATAESAAIAGRGAATGAADGTTRGQTSAAAASTTATGRAAGRADHRRVVAIDGAAAAGKTTVARLLADRLGATLFDTGALYRAVTLAALRAGVRQDDEAALAALGGALRIEIARPSVPDGRLYDVRTNGEDVTWALRDAAVEERVSEVAAHAAVRAALLPVQRRIADGNTVVMVGRDVGTVVVPDAGVKIFLAASLEERARRRHAELRARGKSISLADVVEDLRERDLIDSGRAVAPLRAAVDATIVSTDGKEIEEVVDEVERTVRATWERLGAAGATSGDVTDRGK